MPVPPNELPEGLAAHEYTRLARLYKLMGRQELALEAMSRAEWMAQSGSDESQSDEDKRAREFGVNFAVNVLKALRKSAASEGAEAFAEIRRQMTAVGVPEEYGRQFVERLTQGLSDIKEAPKPPREVPSDLTGSEYRELGQKYKEMGWMEQARAALQFAIDLDPESDSGRKALRFLRSKIPHVPVPLVAEQNNILGFNQMFSGEIEGARQTFQALIREYPDFEWPYGNLGSLLIQTGDIDAARKMLDKAVAINPHYVNAWLHLARLHAINSDLDAAYQCLDRVAEIDPEETDSASVRRAIDDLVSQ
jgi:tetratricopeptide (TPR) repeat protein